MENREIKTAGGKSSGGSKMIWMWIYRMIQGSLIGVGAILPGISGGALCVMFGIYKPVLEFLSHPFKAFKTHFKILLPVIIGAGLGFVGLAKVVAWLFGESEIIAIYLFIGLIAGMMPSLFREAGKEGRTKGSWIILAVTTVIMTAVLLFIKNETSFNIQPTTAWFVVCGVLWGLSLIVPGLSSSTFIIYLGLYEAMSQGIGDLSMKVVLPIGLGVVLTLFALARPMESLLKKHYATVFHIIVGFVIASTISIVPLNFKDAKEILSCAIALVLGFIGAFYLDRLGSKKGVKTEE